MFNSIKIKVNCSDCSLEVPKLLVDDWSTYKGLLEVANELSLDFNSSIVENLLKFQIYFNLTKLDSKTIINSETPFDKRGLMELSIDVYKCAHFLGVMNIVDFVTSNIFFLPDLQLIDNFFQEWNHDQVSKINPDLFKPFYIQKIVDIYIKTEASFLENILKEIFFRQYSQVNFYIHEKWSYYFQGMAITHNNPFATHIGIDCSKKTTVERVKLSFYFKYKWYLNRIGFIENVKTHHQFVSLHRISEETIYYCLNVDPVYIILGISRAIMCLDKNDKKCIIFRDLENQNELSKYYVWYWDPENIRKWRDNSKLIKMNELTLFKVCSDHKVLQVTHEHLLPSPQSE